MIRQDLRKCFKRKSKTRAHKSGRRSNSAHYLRIMNRGLWKVFKKFHLAYFLKWFPVNISAKIYKNVSGERVRNDKMRAHKSCCRPNSAHCLRPMNRGLWKVFKKYHLTYFVKCFPLNIHINVSRERVRNVKTRAHKSGCCLEIVMNELWRFKHSADFLANSSHIIESAAISAS